MKINHKEYEKIISSNIRYFRKKAGLTLGDLAKELKLSYQQMQKYEKGINRISAGKLFQISKLLNIDIDQFFRKDIFDRSSSGQTRSEKKVINFMNIS